MVPYSCFILTVSPEPQIYLMSVFRVGFISIWGEAFSTDMLRRVSLAVLCPTYMFCKCSAKVALFYFIFLSSILVWQSNLNTGCFLETVFQIRKQLKKVIFTNILSWPRMLSTDYENKSILDILIGSSSGYFKSLLCRGILRE